MIEITIRESCSVINKTNKKEVNQCAIKIQSNLLLILILQWIKCAKRIISK